MRSGSGENNTQQHKEDLARAIRYGMLTKTQPKFVIIPIWPTTDPEILNHRDEKSKTPLIHAIEYLVNQQPDSQEHKTALAQVNALLDAGADKTLTFNNSTPFNYLKTLLLNTGDIRTRKAHVTANYALLERLATTNAEKPDIGYLHGFDNSQGFILRLRKRLGYEADAGGICNGYAHMAMQAFLVDPERGTGIAEFEARLKWAKQRGIEKILSDLSKAKQKVKDAATNNATLTKTEEMGLTDNEKMALSVQAFYDGIELYQKTNELSENNENLFGDIKPLSQEAELAAPLAMSQALEEQGGLVTAYRGAGAFTSAELKKYIAALIDLKSTIPVSVTLSAARHAICINYNPTDGSITLIDANNSGKDRMIQKFNRNSAYGDVFNDLTAATKKAFFVKDRMNSDEKLFLSTTLFARASDKTQALDAGKKFGEKLAPYSQFKNADLKARDITGAKLVDHIDTSANKTAYAAIKPKASMTRRRIGVGLLAGLMITASVALALLTGGAALPVIIGGALAGIGIGTAVIAGLLPYLSSDPQERLNQFAKTRGEVGAVLKPTEAPLTAEAQKRLNSTAASMKTLSMATGSGTTPTWTSPAEQLPPKPAVAATPTASPSPSASKTPMEARYPGKPQGPR